MGGGEGARTKRGRRDGEPGRSGEGRGGARTKRRGRGRGDGPGGNDDGETGIVDEDGETVTVDV